MVDEIKHVSPIPREIINKFIRSVCKNITVQLNLTLNYSNVDNVHKILIFTNNLAESEKVHDLLMNRCLVELGSFVEEETGIDREKWNRTLTLFESVVEQNNVTLFW